MNVILLIPQQQIIKMTQDRYRKEDGTRMSQAEIMKIRRFI